MSIEKYGKTFTTPEGHEVQVRDYDDWGGEGNTILNRMWIGEDADGEPEMELNFVIPDDFFKETLNELFPEYYENEEAFYEEYSPEDDAQLIYERAVQEDKLIDEYAILTAEQMRKAENQ